MSKMDEYLNSYLLEHNEYEYVMKIKIKKMLVIVFIITLLIIVVRPLTRIRKAYVDKFTSYASTHSQVNPFKEILTFENNESSKEKSNNYYSGKYPKPIEGVVTCPYGNGHTGIDIQGEHRSNIIAIEDGVVTFAGVQSGYGNCVEIKHHDKNGNIFYSFYAHLYDIKVKNNDEVKMFDVIGKEGGQPGVDPNAGNSTGHHLHFEIRKASGYGHDINPKSYIF